VIFGAAVRADGQPSRALRERTAAAFACGGVTASYIATGAAGRYGPPEAQVMGALLRDFGVPPAQIVQEETGTDTMSSARACARLLARCDGPVRVATSSYHMLRCRMLMRRFGVATTPCPPPPVSQRWRTRWYWRAREALAVPFDFVGSLNPQAGASPRLRHRP
jgi:uncharacterized SAM-binding protein YcdF (DUF218 family)